MKSLEYQGVTFYFVDNQYYFGRSYIYGLGGDEYERFGFFDRAVIDALVHLDFKPDVIHCHDWQTGMIPALLKIQYAQFPFYQDMKTVYTIHNLQYRACSRSRRFGYAGSGRQPVHLGQAGMLRLRELHEGRSGLRRRADHRVAELCG